MSITGHTTGTTNGSGQPDTGLTKCGCRRSEHTPRLVVVTGGPGAGKTAILEIARKIFCRHMVMVPEAASIVFGGGFWREDSESGRKAAQKAIFQVQRSHEEMVLGQNQTAIGLCDRGTLDGLAYWPTDPAELWDEVRSDFFTEMERYSLVIHLRTPGEEQGYNNGNPVRIENSDEARALDEKLLEIWSHHPRHFVIDSTDDFIEKAVQALELIRGELPFCCRHHPQPIRSFNPSSLNLLPQAETQQVQLA